MSVAIAKNAIREFVLSSVPEALCLKGAWGTGKTFAWNEILTKERAKIPLASYSYVSLFGLNSLDAVKRSIFENSIKVSSLGLEPSLTTFKTNTKEVAATLGRKSLGILRQFPYADDFVRGFDAVAFLSIRDEIICIDDLERRGQDLPIRDVLGLTSFLKEQRRCKIVLILNEGELDDKDGDFRRYFEKVMDVEIEFSPTPEKSAQIALSGSSEIKVQMRRNCIALGVSNIRVIRQIERLANIVAPKLAPFDEKILQQAIQTLVLLGWSKQAGSGAPSIEFIRDKRGKSLYGLTKENALSDLEKAWDALLNRYGFTRMDEFDLVLLKGIENGYFDEVALEKEAKKLDEQIKSSQLEGSFSSAWRLYHDSFDNNAPQVIEALEKSFAKAINLISPNNLNGTVKLLKNLGEPEKAKKLIADYVGARKQETTLFDLDRSPFGGDVTDPDVRSAFKECLQDTPDERSPSEVLLKIAKDSSWNPEDIVLLSKLPVDGYYEVLKSAGDKASRIIGACLMFNKLAGADDDMKQIAERSIAALQKLGAESKINWLRVRRYIEIPEPTETV